MRENDTIFSVCIIRLTGIFLALLLLPVCLSFSYRFNAEVAAAEETAVKFDFYDGSEVAYSFFSDLSIGDSYVLPGLPDNIRKKDNVFSYYCANADGVGERFYPGDLMLVSDKSNELFLIWEPAVIQSPDIETTRIFVQKFPKTNQTPKTFAIQGGTLVIREEKNIGYKLVYGRSPRI